MKRTLLLLLIFIAYRSAFPQPEFGIASFYGQGFHGKPTASGHIYSQNELTAAHKTLPLGTVVKVTNTKNNRSVFVKINDRGPYVKGRIIDLSTKAAEILGYRNKGTAYVKIEIVNDSMTTDLLSASIEIAKENGIREYADNSISKDTTLKNSPDVTNDKPADKLEKNTGTETKPPKDIPRPATEIITANTSAIMNRSPYIIITNLDKNKAGFYGVQLGVFSDPSVIFALMEDLEAKYHQPLLIQQVMIDGKTVYKLYMGKFQNRAYADALKLVLSDKYKDAFVMMYE